MAECQEAIQRPYISKTLRVNSSQVAQHLLVNGQEMMPTKPKCHALPTVERNPSLVSAFRAEEYRKCIAALKNNKTTRRHTGRTTK